MKQKKQQMQVRKSNLLLGILILLGINSFAQENLSSTNDTIIEFGETISSDFQISGKWIIKKDSLFFDDKDLDNPNIFLGKLETNYYYKCGFYDVFINTNYYNGFKSASLILPKVLLTNERVDNDLVLILIKLIDPYGHQGTLAERTILFSLTKGPIYTKEEIYDCSTRFPW